MKTIMQWISALAALVCTAPRRALGSAFLFADNVTPDQLRERMTSLTAQARSIQETADRESRPLTAEVERQIEECLAAFDATESDLKRRERMMAQEARLSAPGARKTDPAPAPSAAAAAPAV